MKAHVETESVVWMIIYQLATGSGHLPVIPIT